MSSVFIATVCGLLVALCWGIADWIIGRTSKNTDVLEINFTVQFIGAAIAGAVLLLSKAPLPSQSQMLIIFAASSLIAIGYLLFVKALSSGSVGVVVPLSSTYPLITLVLSIVFLGSVFGSLDIVAMVGIVAGAVLLAYEKNHKKVPTKDFHRETLLAVAAALIWGVAFFILNPLVDRLAWQVMAGLTSLFMALIAIVLLIVTQRSRTLEAVARSITNKNTVIAGLVYEIASIALYLGSAKAASVIIPLILGCSAPLVSSVLAATFDKEKIGALKRVGAVVVIAGIIVLNIA